MFQQTYQFYWYDFLFSALVVRSTISLHSRSNWGLRLYPLEAVFFALWSTPCWFLVFQPPIAFALTPFLFFLWVNLNPYLNWYSLPQNCLFSFGWLEIYPAVSSYWESRYFFWIMRISLNYIYWIIIHFLSIALLMNLIQRLLSYRIQPTEFRFNFVVRVQ